MSPDAQQRLAAQLQTEEGYRRFAYDDATGQTLKRGDRLLGNVSVGVGINLTTAGLEPDEIAWLLQNRISKCLASLQSYDWFTAQDDIRQGALADLCFNLGLTELLRFQSFLSLMHSKNYDGAASNLGATLLAKQEPSRIYRLQQQIRSGEWS